MNTKCRIFSLFSVAAMAFSMVNVSAAGASDDLSAATEFDPVSVMDYDGDGIVGANDCRRLQKYLQGTQPRKDFYDFDNDGVITTVDQVFHKRTAMKETPAELIAEAKNIPTVKSVNVTVHRFKGVDVLEQLSVPDCVYTTRGEFESKFLDLIDFDSDFYNLKETVADVFDEEFFAENSLVMICMRNSCIFERLSLAEKKLLAEIFYDEDGMGVVASDPVIYAYRGLAVAVSKDVLARYDFSDMGWKSNTNVAKEKSVNCNLFRTISAPGQEDSKWINDAAELSAYVDANLSGIFAEENAAEYYKAIAEKYDDAFFEKNKLVTYYIDEPLKCSSDDPRYDYMSYNGFYDETNITLEASLLYDGDELSADCGTFIFFEVDREMCFDNQVTRIYILDPTFCV